MSQTPLNEQLRALENLQEIDLKIDQLSKQKSGYPAQLKGIDDSITKAKSALTIKTASIGEIEKNQRQARAALDLNKDRLDRSTARLEQVQNSTEYNALQKEIEQLKKLNLNLDEQITKATSDIENAKKGLETAQTEITQLEATRAEKMEAFNGHSGQLDSQISSLNAERKPWLDKVEVRIVSQYDRVRKARGGMGIAPTVAGRCLACNMLVPPQLFNEVQKSSALHNCPNCHRILYIKTAAAPQS